MTTTPTYCPPQNTTQQESSILKSILKVIGFFFGFVVLSVVLIVVFLLLSNGFNEQSLYVPATFIGPVLAEILCAVGFLIYTNTKGLPIPFAIFSSIKKQHFNISHGIAIGFLLFITFHVVIFALSLLGVNIGSSENANLANSTTNLSLGITLGTMGLLSPIAEELFFRGVLLSILDNALGSSGRAFMRFLPVLIVSTLFATMHYQGFSNATDCMVLALTFTLGVISATMTRKTGSLLGGIATHMTYNLLTVAVSFVYLFVVSA